MSLLQLRSHSFCSYLLGLNASCARKQKPTMPAESCKNVPRSSLTCSNRTESNKSSAIVIYEGLESLGKRNPRKPRNNIHPKIGSKNLDVLVKLSRRNRILVCGLNKEGMSSTTPEMEAKSEHDDDDNDNKNWRDNRGEEAATFLFLIVIIVNGGGVCSDRTTRCVGRSGTRGRGRGGGIRGCGIFKW